MEKRLTGYAHGGGCACKIPPGELEAVVADLRGSGRGGNAELVVGLDDGDDAAVVTIADGTAVVVTADFFTPVVDDAYDWGGSGHAGARGPGPPCAGGHSVDDPEPKYGMAVTGIADPNRLLRNDSGVAGLP